MSDDSRTIMIERFRPRVEAELRELKELSEATVAQRAPVELDQQSVGRLSRIDAMQGRELAAEGERRRRIQIDRLQRTLDSMSAGSFGECEGCGEPIALGRLEIDPSVHLCIGCARLRG